MTGGRETRGCVDEWNLNRTAMVGGGGATKNNVVRIAGSHQYLGGDAAHTTKESKGSRRNRRTTARRLNTWLTTVRVRTTKTRTGDGR